MPSSMLDYFDLSSMLTSESLNNEEAYQRHSNGAKYLSEMPEAVVIIGMPDTRRIWEPFSQDSGSSKQAVLPVPDHHTASSSSSVGKITSYSQSTLHGSQVNFKKYESESHYAASAPSSIADTTSDARSVFQDNRENLSEVESDSLSDGSFYDCCEDL
jgi:hypothetical protein